jgi:hypothetical protein
MKIKLSVIALGLWALAVSAPAQEQQPFELTEPLIRPTPAASAWIARCTYAPGSPSEADARNAYQANLNQMAAEDPAAVKLLASVMPRFFRWSSRAVTKSGNVRHELGLYTSGERAERWQRGSFAVSRDPFTGKVKVVTDAGADADFPELAWVSRGNFKGVETFQGRKVLVFEDRLERSQVANPREFTGKMGVEDEYLVATKAVIDLETRLPVALAFGEERWIYEMQSPPTGPLVVPPDFAKVIDGVVARNEARNRPLSKP